MIVKGSLFLGFVSVGSSAERCAIAGEGKKKLSCKFPSFERGGERSLYLKKQLLCLGDDYGAVSVAKPTLSKFFGLLQSTSLLRLAQVQRLNDDAMQWREGKKMPCTVSRRIQLFLFVTGLGHPVPNRLETVASATKIWIRTTLAPQKEKAKEGGKK